MSREDGRFPVLKHYTFGTQEYIPWAFAETFRQQAEGNHYQGLERLAERGGLSWKEVLAAALHTDFRSLRAYGEADCRDQVLTLVSRWESQQKEKPES